MDKLVIAGPVECYGGPWLIEYTPGARLADIYFNGHSVDCVEVREWDWDYGVADQPAPVPSRARLHSVLVSWVADNGAAYVTGYDRSRARVAELANEVRENLA